MKHPFKKNIGLYSTHSMDLVVLIPKLRGVGYVKAPFGGHHSNQYYRAFMMFDFPLHYFGCCDADGYLIIPLTFNTQQEHKELVENVLKALIEIFPRISEFKKIEWNDYFDIVEKN